MTVITVRNSGLGTRVYYDINKRQVPVRPNQHATFNAHEHLVKFIDRASAKGDPVSITAKVPDPNAPERRTNEQALGEVVDRDTGGEQAAAETTDQGGAGGEPAPVAPAGEQGSAPAGAGAATAAPEPPEPTAGDPGEPGLDQDEPAPDQGSTGVAADFAARTERAQELERALTAAPVAPRPPLGNQRKRR